MRINHETCRNGLHPWIEANIGTRRDGRRLCLLCQRERTKKATLAKQGQPCKGCHREGLYLQSTGMCNTCCRRHARGIPLDTPISIGRTPSEPKAPNPRKPAKPRTVKPTKPAKPTTLPAGWNEKAPTIIRRTKPGGQALPDLGTVIPPSNSQIATVRALLARHDALDLADALGLTPKAAEPPQAEPAPARRTDGKWSARWERDLAFIQRQLWLGFEWTAIAADLGCKLSSLETRLQKHGETQLATEARQACQRWAA